MLLVEDERAIRFTTGVFLREAGYNVLSAESPEEALRMVDEHSGRIELLLTDVVMPNMGGRELAAMVKERCPGVECLYMSGYTTELIEDMGALDKGVHFINKPFTRAALTEEVRRLLTRV